MLELIHLAGIIMFALFFSQAFKTVLNFLTTRKLNLKMFVSDGDFPSTHTTTSITAVISVWYKTIPIVIYGSTEEIRILAIAVTATIGIWALYIIKDAMGIRLSVQELSKTVYSVLTDSQNVEENSPITSNLQNYWAELAKSINLKVGHMPHEVIGGAILGTIFGALNCFIDAKNTLAIILVLIALVVYVIITIFVITRKKHNK